MTVAYDYCVLATGSDASLPRFVDPSVEGVFVYRNISDLNRLLAYSEKLQETKKVTVRALQLILNCYVPYSHLVRLLSLAAASWDWRLPRHSTISSQSRRLDWFFEDLIPYHASSTTWEGKSF